MFALADLKGEKVEKCVREKFAVNEHEITERGKSKYMLWQVS